MQLITPILLIGPVGDMAFVIANSNPPGTTSLSLMLFMYLWDRNIANENSTTNKEIATGGAMARINPFASILGVLTNK